VRGCLPVSLLLSSLRLLFFTSSFSPRRPSRHHSRGRHRLHLRLCLCRGLSVCVVFMSCCGRSLGLGCPQSHGHPRRPHGLCLCRCHGCLGRGCTCGHGHSCGSAIVDVASEGAGPGKQDSSHSSHTYCKSHQHDHDTSHNTSSTTQPLPLPQPYQI
jgi:hypothetical protein